MKPNPNNVSLLFACLLAVLTTACTRSKAPDVAATWNPKLAASYLDQRETWWMTWTGATRDHGTFCVSCHTALPYALARPVLRKTFGDPKPSAQEQALVENVTKRVRLWKEDGPYYSDKGEEYKTSESRGTEAVLNAFILSNRDAETRQLSPETRAAFDNMWAEQQKAGDLKGAWSWLQFDQEPWEARDSVYYGASLAAMAVADAPGNYAATPEIQDNLNLLREYLIREEPAQSTINRIFLLWTSTKWPGLLSPEQQKAIIREALGKQQSDGGWRLASIVWRWNGWHVRSIVNLWLREDGTPLDGKSDGVATGLITLVLQQAGVPGDNAQLQRGRAWLLTHQNSTDGSWPATSVNKRHHISSDTGRFMSDAATAYAVLALLADQKGSEPVATLSNHSDH